MLRTTALGLALSVGAVQPAWAAPGVNVWLSDPAHHRLLWMVLYVLLGLLVLLVAWEAQFQWQRRRERIQVDLSASQAGAPSTGGGMSRSAPPAGGRVSSGASPAASDDDPFKSLLRRSAAAASAESGEERSRGSVGGRPVVPAPVSGGEPLPAASAPPPPTSVPRAAVPPAAVSPAPPFVPFQSRHAAPASPASDAEGAPDGSSAEASPGGRKLVRLGRTEDPGESASPASPSGGPSTAAAPPPAQVPARPAPASPAGGGGEAWGDLLKKATGPVGGPPPSPPGTGEPASDGGDPWKSLLKRTRDEGTGTPASRLPVRPPGTSVPAARPAVQAPTVQAPTVQAPAVQAPAVQAPTVRATVSPAVAPPPPSSPVSPEGVPAVVRGAEARGTVALPEGSTRASWDQGVASLQAATVGRVEMSASTSDDLLEGGAPASPSPAEPRRGRRMKLGGGPAEGPEGESAPPPRIETVPSPRPGGAAGGGSEVSQGPAGRRFFVEPGEATGASMKLPPRPSASGGLRVVRSTRDAQGGEEQENPGLLRNAAESQRPGEVP